MVNNFLIEMWLIIYAAICYCSICRVELVVIYTFLNTSETGSLILAIGFGKCCKMKLIGKIIKSKLWCYVCISFNCKNICGFNYRVSYRLKTSVLRSPVVFDRFSVSIMELGVLESCCKSKIAVVNSGCKS